MKLYKKKNQNIKRPTPLNKEYKSTLGILNEDYIRNNDFIIGNRRYYNGITIIILKFDCYIWKACKRWCIRKIYISKNILILRSIICTKE